MNLTTTLENWVSYTDIYLWGIHRDKYVYRVNAKEPLDVPYLFGKMPPWSDFSGEECLIFKYTYNDRWEREYSLFTTNPDALERTKIKQPIQGEGLILIAKFMLTGTSNEACFFFGEYRIVLKFSEYLRERELVLHVYKEGEPNHDWKLRFKGLVGHH